MLGPPVQIAYAVEDVRAAARAWGDRGAGPFLVRDHIELTDVEVDGRPGTFDHSAAYGQWGDVMLELLTIHEPSATPLGLHHLAFFVADLDAGAHSLVTRGWSESLSARTPGGSRFAHFDARDELGHFVEIYERTPSITRLFEQVRAATQ